MDYSRFINQHAGRRRPQITRELTKRHYNAPKESVSLAEGMPNETTFPFESITINLKDGNVVHLEQPELSAALQYNPTQGYPPLLKTLKEFTQFVHDPPNWANCETLVTVGSQDAISKSIEMCMVEGDPILVQNPLYAGTEAVLKPFRPTIHPVDQDHEGMVPELLEEVLYNRKMECEKNPALRMPKMMYLNPTASNPTGTTIPLERRHEIYRICCNYDIIILEDDAYYFLHFLEHGVPSFLSLDTEGRVLRFDSFSKIMCPGLRIGWLTGPKQLVQNIELHAQSSYLHASSLNQIIINSLFTTWGFDAFIDRLNTIRDYYKARRDVTLQSMEKHLKGLCEWAVPSGGMFVWIKVKGISDVYDMLMTRGLKKLITFVPGHAFMADPTAACSHIRASFSKAQPAQIDLAMKLLAELITEEKELLNNKLNNV